MALLRLLIAIYAPQLLQQLVGIAPWLEALKANDYPLAATLFLQFGSVKDVMSKLPADQQALAAAFMPNFMKALDSIIPEEQLLSLEKALTA